MKYINYLISIILLFLISGCTKEETISYYQINEETKAWVYFRTSSYWIYQDSTLSQIDSIAVDSSFFEKKFHEAGPNWHPSYYDDELKIYYSENHYSLLYDLMASGSALTRFYGNGSRYAFFTFEHNEIGHEVFDHNGHGEKVGSITFLNHYDQYLNEGYIFNNVYEVKYKDFVHSRSIHYFRAINVGIIKQRVEDEYKVETWNLIRWNVVQ